jgi:hypothetical protein
MKIINFSGNKKALDEVDLTYCTFKEKMFIYLLKNNLFLH